jgi:DNA repair protein RadC
VSTHVKNEAVASYAAMTYDTDDAIIAQALSILEKRLVARREDSAVLSNPEEAGRFIQLRSAASEREVFCALFLDNRHRMLAYEELFFGTVDSAEVHPREVVKAALRHNAGAVILGHNHPSGDATPSAADRALTVRIKQALELVGVRLLDHFVVGEGAPVSMASRGWV